MQKPEVREKNLEAHWTPHQAALDKLQFARSPAAQTGVIQRVCGDVITAGTTTQVSSVN